jgi:hypothetical protein
MGLLFYSIPLSTLADLQIVRYILPAGFFIVSALMLALKAHLRFDARIKDAEDAGAESEKDANDVTGNHQQDPGHHYSNVNDNDLEAQHSGSDSDTTGRRTFEFLRVTKWYHIRILAAVLASYSLGLNFKFALSLLTLYYWGLRVTSRDLIPAVTSIIGALIDLVGLVTLYEDDSSVDGICIEKLLLIVAKGFLWVAGPLWTCLISLLVCFWLVAPPRKEASKLGTGTLSEIDEHSGLYPYGHDERMAREAGRLIWRVRRTLRNIQN